MTLRAEDLPPAIRKRAGLDNAVTEAELSANVARLAKLKGWMGYHTHDSRRSEAGWLDWVFIRPPRIVFAELKRQRGRVTSEQDQWIQLLRACGQEVYLWRPSSWDEIERVLS